MTEADSKYREMLVKADQKAQEDYDKTILLLSGGALGISLGFLKDIVGDRPAEYSGWLIASWASWAASLTCVLASYYFSQQAIRRMIRELDAGRIYAGYPAGCLGRATAFLNAAGGLLFVVGVVTIVVFVSQNMG
jgi:hypothetical protein